MSFLGDLSLPCLSEAPKVEEIVPLRWLPAPPLLLARVPKTRLERAREAQGCVHGIEEENKKGGEEQEEKEKEQ